MAFFHHEEPPNGFMKRNFLTSTLKCAFSHCHHFCGRLSSSSPEEKYTSTSDDDDQEIFVSAVISRYMEAKDRRKSWVFPPTTVEFSITRKEMKREEENEAVEETEEFFSVGSCLSCCSSTTNMDAFVSVKSNLSRCSSLSRIELLPGIRRRWSIVEEFCHCEGWPFGLCRKALLLPPLPKATPEPWSWRKSKSARLLR